MNTKILQTDTLQICNLDLSLATHLFYATKHSSCFDIPANEDVIIPSGEVRAIRTGLRLLRNLSLPSFALELQIRPRSGLAFHDYITVLNSPATIDMDCEAEIRVLLINHGKKDFVVAKGMRIAQASFQPVCNLSSIRVLEVERKDGVFGSTGR